MNIQGPCSSLSDIQPKWIDQCQRGKWFHWNRIYLVKNERGITVVSLNALQRLAKAFSSLFGTDYFAKVLKSKTIEVLNAAKAGKGRKPARQNPPLAAGLQNAPAPAILPAPVPGSKKGAQAVIPPQAAAAPVRVRDAGNIPLSDNQKLFYLFLHQKIEQRQQAALLEVSPYDPGVQIPEYTPADFRRNQDLYAAIHYMLTIEKSIVGYGVKSYEPGAGNTLIKVSQRDFVDPHLILERYLITN